MTTFYAYYIYVHIHMYVYNFVSCLKCKHFPIITYSSKTFSLWLYEEYNLWKHASEIFQFFSINQFSSVQSLSRVWLFVTPWIAARQASLSITNSQSSLRLTSIEYMMPSSHLILCHPLLLLPPIPPSIRVFSNKSALCMRWPKYWSFSFSISPSKEIPGLISSEWTCWTLLAVSRDSQGTLKGLSSPINIIFRFSCC